MGRDISPVIEIENETHNGISYIDCIEGMYKFILGIFILLCLLIVLGLQHFKQHEWIIIVTNISTPIVGSIHRFGVVFLLVYVQ